MRSSSVCSELVKGTVIGSGYLLVIIRLDIPEIVQPNKSFVSISITHMNYLHYISTTFRRTKHHRRVKQSQILLKVHLDVDIGDVKIKLDPLPNLSSIRNEFQYKFVV